MLALDRIFLKHFIHTKEREIIRLIWRDIKHRVPSLPIFQYLTEIFHMLCTNMDPVNRSVAKLKPPSVYNTIQLHSSTVHDCIHQQHIQTSLA